MTQNYMISSAAAFPSMGGRNIGEKERNPGDTVSSVLEICVKVKSSPENKIP